MGHSLSCIYLQCIYTICFSTVSIQERDLQSVTQEGALTFDINSDYACGVLDVQDEVISFIDCTFPLPVFCQDLSFVPEEEKPEDKEDELVYAGTQLEFCLLTIDVCKEVIPLCGMQGIDQTYCCRGKVWYWPLFKAIS